MAGVTDGFWFLNPVFPTVKKQIVVDVISHHADKNTRSLSTQFQRVHSCASVVGHARKQSAVWRSAQVCNGHLVHNNSDHERDHNHWSLGDAGPNSDTSGRGKKKGSQPGPCSAYVAQGPITRKPFRNREWHPRCLAVDLAPTTVHDLDEDDLSFHFWTISQYGSTALHWNVAFDMCCLGGEDRKILLAGGANMDEQRG